MERVDIFRRQHDVHFVGDRTQDRLSQLPFWWDRSRIEDHIETERERRIREYNEHKDQN